jgi:hypothetical protein
LDFKARKLERSLKGRRVKMCFFTRRQRQVADEQLHATLVQTQMRLKGADWKSVVGVWDSGSPATIVKEGAVEKTFSGRTTGHLSVGSSDSTTHRCGTTMDVKYHACADVLLYRYRAPTVYGHPLGNDQCEGVQVGGQIRLREQQNWFFRMTQRVFRCCSNGPTSSGCAKRSWARAL